MHNKAQSLTDLNTVQVNINEIDLNVSFIPLMEVIEILCKKVYNPTIRYTLA